MRLSLNWKKAALSGALLSGALLSGACSKEPAPAPSIASVFGIFDEEFEDDFAAF